MSWLTQLLATLVAVEMFYIFWLETLGTTSARTARVFGLTRVDLARPVVTTLLKNQGVYNCLLGVLIWGATWLRPDRTAVLALMFYVVLVAAYGGLTSRPRIFLLQGSLPLLALLTGLF